MQINTDYAEICRQLCIIKSGNLPGASQRWRRSSSNRKLYLRPRPAEHGQGMVPDPEPSRATARSQSRSQAPSTARSQGPEPNRGRGVPGRYPGGPNRGWDSAGTETIYIINLTVGIPRTHPQNLKTQCWEPGGHDRYPVLCFVG